VAYLFPGEKNGRKIGQKFCIAVSDVKEIKIPMLKFQIPIK